MRFWVGWAALLALLVVASPVLAAQGTFAGQSGTPIRVAGDRDVAAQDATFLLSGDDGQFSLLLQGAEGKATRVIQRAFGIVSTDDPRAEILWSQDVDREELDLRGALLSVSGREPEFQVLVRDGGIHLAQGAERGTLGLGLLGSRIHVTESLRPPLSVQLVSDAAPFSHTIPSGLYAAGATDGLVKVDGPFRLFISGATLAWVPPSGDVEQFHAYFHTETREGTIYNPLTGTWTGGGSHTEYVQEYLLVEATAGRLEMQYKGLAGALYAKQPAVTVDGQAVLPRMRGTVTVVEDDVATIHPLTGEDLTLAGRFTLEPSHPMRDGTTQVRGTGDFTTVSYGPVKAHYDWATAAVAVGLGAVVLAAFAWLASNAKAILGTVGGGAVALYARVHGDEVLEHPGRAEVYERVKAFPGVNFVQLSKEVTFGASTLNYHLRVLEKNGYITSVRDGRYLRFFDRTSGSYAGNRKMAVSALRNTTTAAIAQHIRDNPGIAQCDLAARFEVTPSTVTWHINRLAAQGLVTKAREGAHTRYYLGEGWAALPAEEQARQAAPLEPRPAPVAVTA